MVQIGIIRCEKNEARCPLTGCIRSLEGAQQGFAAYDQARLAGVFTCRCPGDKVVEMGRILKSKGAEAIHFCTCTFAHKEDGQWVAGDGFCDQVETLMERVAREAQIPCVKGSAHLPSGYRPESVPAA